MTGLPPPPLLVYDGACEFCRQWVQRLQVIAGERVNVAPCQDVAEELGIPLDECGHSVRFLPESGDRTQGAEAVFGALAAAGRGASLNFYQRFQAFARVSEAVYRLVVDHRMIVSRIVRFSHGADLREDPWTRTRSLYLRLLGLSLFLAVISYWNQIQGLNGANGILPAADLVDMVNQVSDERGWSAWQHFRAMPSLFRLYPADGMLHGLAGMATLGSLCLILGLIPGPALVLVLLGWGSIVTIGGTFSGYQWDILNIEICFASLFVAPWKLRLVHAPGVRATRSGRWILRGLLFKFVFLNGMAKLVSGDPAWASLTAIQYHYWTQPMTNAISWHAYHLPLWIHKASVVGTFFVELILPVFIFGPRRMRQIAFFGITVLMVGMHATGSFGTFNLMTIALCIALLDDGALRSLVPARWRFRVADTRAEPHRSAAGALRWPRGVLVGLLMLLNFRVVATGSGISLPSPEWLEALDRESRRLHLVNAYGAFPNMTEDRPEVLFEGSMDGHTWIPYVLRYKTHALDENQRYTAHHMPRLDGQLWFSAHRCHCQNARWYLHFMTRLLEGQPEVLQLLGDNPFPQGPPAFIRSSLWAYTFTTPEERSDTGNIWNRQRIGEFCPPLTLEDGQVVAVRPADGRM